MSGIDIKKAPAASYDLAMGNSITGATAGSILFAGAAGILAQDNSNIFFDDTNNRLGIGINSSILARLHVKGSGATSASYNFYTENSSSIIGLAMKDNGSFGINKIPDNAYAQTIKAITGHSYTSVHLDNSNSLLYTFGIDGRFGIKSDTMAIGTSSNGVVGGLSFKEFGFDNSNTPTSGVDQFRFKGATNILTSGNNTKFRIGAIISGGSTGLGGFSPTSGTANYNEVEITPYINQTGGASGIVRGLYYNPSIIAAADHRAIETVSGKIIFGGLPTSAAGLPTGAIWNNLGVLNIV